MIDLYPNLTLPIMWLIFMGVFWVLTHFVFEPTLHLIEERKKRTDGLRENAAALRETTATLLATYEKRMTEARLVSARAREEIINKARSEEREILARARKENEQTVLEMKGSIQTEKKETELRLRQYVRQLAVDMVSRILEREVAGSGNA